MYQAHYAMLFTSKWVVMQKYHAPGLWTKEILYLEAVRLPKF